MASSDQHEPVEVWEWEEAPSAPPGLAGDEAAEWQGRRVVFHPPAGDRLRISGAGGPAGPGEGLADGPLRQRCALPPPPVGEDHSAAALDPVFTPALKVRFLDELAQHGNVRVAAGRCGVSRSGAYLARRRDADFALGWRAALVLAREHVEATLAERALDGVEEPVFYHGEVVAVRRRFDSRLLLAHLARLDALCAEDEVAWRAAERFDVVLAAASGLVDPGVDAVEDLPSRAEAIELAARRAAGGTLARERRAAREAAARHDALEAAAAAAVDAVRCAHPAATGAACGEAGLAPLPPAGGVGGGSDAPLEVKSLCGFTRRHEDTKILGQSGAPQAIQKSGSCRTMDGKAAAPHARPLRVFVCRPAVACGPCEPKSGAQFSPLGTLSIVSTGPTRATTHLPLGGVAASP
ncbi:hypothetical protein [Novosphingobium sp.]|uniref:hypothetical protein n=1 Tax=Novosphingobium sp. TaxID=1874826 RepID=UPI0025E385B0|nr:hypothetical protein [Novosphingobium sp.]MCC6924542.1 hypothetical protein [Novosphingobium sp.]